MFTSQTNSKEQAGKPWVAILVTTLMVLFSLFHLYTAWFQELEPYYQYLTTVVLALMIGWITYPLGRKSWRDTVNRWVAVDVICIAATMAVYLYAIYSRERWVYAGSAWNTADSVMAGILVLLVLEGTRRVVGLPIVAIATFFIIQVLTAEYWIGIFYGPSVPIEVLTQILALTEVGIFTTPVVVVSTYLIVFMFLAAFLLKSGVGLLFVNLANSLAGRFAGGPAKIAVFASAMVGTMQGAAMSNVVTTGSFTIPMMKRSGYKPHFAGAVEAVASNGGQVMPPIMGLTAFVIAQVMGIPYFRVCLAALIPAFLYFVCVLTSVHLEAKKMGLKGLLPEQVPRLRTSLIESWPLIITFSVVVYGIGMGYGLAMTGMAGIMTLFTLSFFNRRTRLSGQKLLEVFVDCARISMIPAFACATAGIISGVFYISGLGDVMAMIVVALADQNLLLALIVTGVICLTLGMGLPTIAVYITMLVIVIPALIKVGVNPMAAHMFCFFLGTLAHITPPYCTAAFAAAGIAESAPMKTGFTSMRLAFPLYIIPFFFVYDPSFLSQGSVTSILLAAATGAIGAMAIAAGFEGWVFRQARWWERGLLLVGGGMMIAPQALAKLAGFTLIVVAVLFQASGGWFGDLRKGQSHGSGFSD